MHYGHSRRKCFESTVFSPSLSFTDATCCNSGIVLNFQLVHGVSSYISVLSSVFKL
jgi:hypothetical protein